MMRHLYSAHAGGGSRTLPEGVRTETYTKSGGCS